MGKVIGTIGVVVGAVALVATGIGAIAAPALAGAVTIGGVSASTLLLAGTALQAVGRVLTKQPKVSNTSVDRLNASLVTDTPRKMVFGRTAMNTDLRYQEWWGADQEYCGQVFVLASHHCAAVEEIWLDDKLAWSAAGGVTGEFAGYLTVQYHAQATTGSVFNAGWSRRWGAQTTFTGCSTLYLQFKVTGNGKKGKSPFTSSITARVTVIGKGALLPDPRFDSTAGGAGNLRVADQTTWAWALQGHEIGRNPALGLLFYLIGWRIQNPVTGEWKLAVGRGVPVDRINLDSFITAANLCDEQVIRANGASEPRYRCDGTFSEADDPTQVIANFETCMNGKLRDSAGRFSLQVLHNDLATPVLDFTDDDVLGDFTWTAGNDLNDRRNVVRGRYTDPAALYQLADFPQIKLPPLDGIDRIESLDLALVQSPGQAQRLAKQRLQRQQYEGEFRASFNARGWAVKDGDIVRLTFAALGFDKKLFRVSEGLIDPSGTVPLALGEENAAIYAWDREEAAAVQAGVPNTFDPLMLPIIAAIDDAGRTAEWPAIVGEGKPDDYATNSADPNSPFGPGTVKEALATLDKIVPIEAQFGPITSDISALKDAKVGTDAALGALGDRLTPAEAQISALALADDAAGAALAALGGVVFDQAAIQRQAERAVGRVEESVLRALVESARTRDVLRDAGFVVDPVTGQVRIYAIDQLKDRTSIAEQTIDAVKGIVTTKASVNQVNELIALAVLDPSQIAELTPIIARLTEAESQIDGLNAAVRLKASIAELTALAARTRTTEIDVDAMKGEIALKASADVVDQLGLRTSEIEQTLTALPDTAGLVVTVNQARGVADDTAEGLLRSLAAGENAERYQLTQIAQARQELSTRMADGFSSAALAQTLLSVKVDATTAIVLQEASASITREGVLSRRIDAQGVALDGQSAQIGRLDQASIDAAGGIASSQMTIRQIAGAADNSDEAVLRAIADGETSTQARNVQLVQIRTEFSTMLIADQKASAIAQQAIQARLAGAEAAIVSTSKVLADTTGAYGSRIVALELAYSDPVTGLGATRVRINAVETASADADTALGERIDTVEAVVNNDVTGLAAVLATVVSNRKAQADSEQALTERADAQGVVLGDQAAAIGRLDRASITAAGGIASSEMTIRQAIAGAADDAEALLRALAAGETEGRANAAQLVQIQTSFTASLVAGQVSDAVARQALLARLGLAEAAIVTTSRALADTQRAFVLRQDALEAAFNDAATGLLATRGRIIDLEEVTAEANRVVTHRLDLMDAQLLDPVTGAPISGATIAADRQAVATALGATATQVEQLRTDYSDPVTGLPATNARLDREGTARSQGDQASAAALELVKAEIRDPVSGLTALAAEIVQLARATLDGDSANADLIQQVRARLDSIGGVSIEQKFEALVEATGRILGTATVAIDTNNNMVGWQLIGSPDSRGSLNLINADFRMGTGRVIFNNGTFMWVQGVAFGIARDLLEWFGPTMALDQCSRANAKIYKAIDGDSYFGGSLTAGTRKNNGGSTGLGPNDVAELGPFGSDGKPVKYVVSWSYRTQSSRVYPPTAEGLRSYKETVARYNATEDFGILVVEHPASTITLTRAFAGGAFSQIDQGTFTTETQTFVGSAPSPGDAPGRADFTTTIGGGFTVNDPVQSANDRTVRLTLSRGFTAFGDAVSQRLTIVAIEE